MKADTFLEFKSFLEMNNAPFTVLRLKSFQKTMKMTIMEMTTVIMETMRCKTVVILGIHVVPVNLLESVLVFKLPLEGDSACSNPVLVGKPVNKRVIMHIAL